MSRFNILKDECFDPKSDIIDSNGKAKVSLNSTKPKKKKNKKSKAVVENVKDDWVQKDQEICDINYEKDVEEAILQSQLEVEHQRQKSESEAQYSFGNEMKGDLDSLSKAAKGKNRNKNRARDGQQKTVSLNEFQNMSVATNSGKHHGSSMECKEPPVETLFDDVQLAAKRFIGKEKDKEEYERRYKVEAVIRGQYIVQLEDKQKIIDSQGKEIEDLKSELLNTQSLMEAIRNEKIKLEKILQKGKMSELKNMLEEMEDLSQIRDDLTNQISELTTELEKERSVSHSLRSELDRLKASKSTK